MNKRKLNTLRIIGGRWRRRLFNFPDIPELRPTHDRIREILFNWLQPYIKGSSCLDLFAGSGALGFEALSQGADKVTFVDNHPKAIEQINTTSRLFGIDPTQIEMVLGSCLQQELSFVNSPFDIVFLDPPFHNEQLRLPEVVIWLMTRHHLSKNALIYIETDKRRELVTPKEWYCLKKGSTKHITYCLFRREEKL